MLRSIYGRKYAIQPTATNKYLNVQGEGKYRRVEASKDPNDEVEKTSRFTILPLLSIMAHKNWRYVCAENDCQKSLQANREWNYGW